MKRFLKKGFSLSPIAIQSMLSGDDSIDPLRKGTYSITVRVSMPTAATTTATTSRTAETKRIDTTAASISFIAPLLIQTGFHYIITLPRD